MKKIALYIVLFFICSPVLAMEQSFYILRNYSSKQISTAPDAQSSLTNHFKKIDILISQAYRIDEQGEVTGDIDPAIGKFAKEHQVKLMVLVTNVGFDKKKAHQFLSAKKARQKALKKLLELCKQNNFYGVQFDFEGISRKDAEALTLFYSNAADILKRAGFHVSFAVIPMTNDDPQITGFLKNKYENWAGAYDLKTLGKKSDFITIMSYDQHQPGTSPGPTASLPWVEETIKHTMKYVPTSKISLGVPVYSGHWSVASHGKRVTFNLTDINYQDVETIIKKQNVNLNWDKTNQVNYVVYLRHWLNEYLFVEDSQSFEAKLKLAERYHLRGLSVFSLGDEDPKIWDKIIAKK